MARLYMLEMKDGSVAIMEILKGTVKGEIEKAFPEGQVVSHKTIKRSDLPKDRIFRDAWKRDGDKCKECPDRSKELIRKKRNRALEELDKVAFSESRKPNGDMAAIDKEAQRLRDIPQHPDFESTDITKLKKLFESIDNGSNN
jgi:hypothetical protein